jgi:hypothetical protein
MRFELLLFDGEGGGIYQSCFTPDDGSTIIGYEVPPSPAP